MPDPQNLIDVIQRLTSPQGCPWDRKQTPHSLSEYLLEETFELVEAIRSRDQKEVKEELGDVFFLLFFISHLLEGDTYKLLGEVWENSVWKMVRRHPHVFGNLNLNDDSEIREMWQEIKKQEKQSSDGEKRKNPFESIPDSLPPLLKAYRLNSRAAEVSFTWTEDREQERALHQEWQEWIAVRSFEDFSKKELEFGDLLFSLVEHARRYGLKANAALQLANAKFIKRIRAVLDLAEQRGLDWESLDMRDKDKLWEEVKTAESNKG